MKKDFPYIGIILGLAFIIRVGCLLHYKQNITPQEAGVGCSTDAQQRIVQPAPSDLPTIKEIQERIGAEPDGILGPETQRLWDKVICNQNAKRYFE